MVVLHERFEVESMEIDARWGLQDKKGMWGTMSLFDVGSRPDNNHEGRVHNVVRGFPKSLPN